MRRAFCTQDDHSSLRTSGAPRMCTQRERTRSGLSVRHSHSEHVPFSAGQIGSFGRAHRFADREGRSRVMTEGKARGEVVK